LHKYFRTASRATKLLPVVCMALLLGACGGETSENLMASAKSYLAKDDPKAAIIQLKNVLQEDVTLAEARHLLGLALLRSGDAIGGEAELRRALSYNYPTDTVLPPLAEAMLAQKQYRKLTDEFSGEKLQNPAAQARLQATLAEAYTAMGNLDRAHDALQSALAADAQYVPALLGLARAKAAKRDFDGARVDLEKVLATKPDAHEAWRLMGDVHWYGSRRRQEAMAAYRKAIELKADYVEGHASILDAMIEQGQVDAASAQLTQLKAVAAGSVSVLYYETLLAHLHKDIKQARNLSRQLLQQASTDVRSLQLAGEIELSDNAPAQAQVYLSEALRLSPHALRTRRMLVRAYLRAGQPAKALATLQPALEGDKADAATNALAGEVYLQEGDLRKAQEYFGRSARQDPANTRTRTSLALVRMSSGNGSAAIGDLQEIAAADRGHATDLVLISALVDRKEFDKALRAIDALEKKQADKPLAANLRGHVLLAKSDLAGARRAFERALVIDPTFFPPAARLAAMDLADKKPTDAARRFEAMLALDAKSYQALLALAELRARSGSANSEVAELLSRAVAANPGIRQSHLTLVEFHLRNLDYKQALAAAQNAVAAVPDDPAMLDTLGRVQQASGDTNQALATFGKLAALMPESPMPHMRLANAHLAMKDVSAAGASLRKAIAAKPDFLDAQRGLMMLAVEAKNYGEALTIARTVQKQRPKEAAGYVFEGDVAAVQQRWDVAEAAYRLGLKQNPNTLILATKVHNAIGSAGKASAASGFAADWLKRNPKDAAFRLYLGDQASARGDLASAEKLYASAAQLQPSNASAFNNLAWVGGKLGRATALGHAEKAIALDPVQPAFMDTLAMLLALKKDYVNALTWQTKAVALQPQIGIYRLNLAKIYIAAGSKDLARKELDVLAKLGDKFGGQTEVASLLGDL
jgi:cellulose synthase operon protein C